MVLKASRIFSEILHNLSVSPSLDTLSKSFKAFDAFNTMLPFCVIPYFFLPLEQQSRHLFLAPLHLLRAPHLSNRRATAKMEHTQVPVIQDI